MERFTYTVSHDLKSPLITITGFVGLLEADVKSGNTEKFKGDLHRIKEAAEKMKSLLDELLELSRIGRIINPPTDTPLAKIVEEALALVKRIVKVHDGRIWVESEGEGRGSMFCFTLPIKE